MATAVPDDLIDVPDDLVDVPAPRAAAARAPAPPPGVPHPIGARPEPAAPALAPRTFMDQIRGLREAATEIVSMATGGTVGGLGGFVGGIAAALGGARFKGEPGQNVGLMAHRALEQGVTEGAQRGTAAVRTFLRGSDGRGTPVSETGQEYIEGVSGALQNAPALMAAPRGTVGMSPQQPLGIKPALQAAGDTARAAGSRVVDAALPAMTPEVAATVVKANEGGIPVAPHQLVENRVLQFLGESAENVPFSGGGKTRKARVEGFSRGLAALIDPEAAQGVRVLDQRTFRDLQDMAGKRIGAVYDRLGGVPREAIGDLVEAAAQHSEAGIRDTIATFARRLDATADQHGGAVPGPLLRQLRTEAARLERETKASRPDLSAAYERVTKKLDDAIEPFAADGDVPLLAEARRQYAVSKTLEPLVARHPNGKIPPGELHSALTSTEKGRTRMARGTAGEQGEYARLGKEILEENVLSDSPTHHASFRGAGAMATGGLAGAYYLGGPAGALGAWGGSALYNLIGPRAVQWAAKRTLQRTAPVPEAPPPGLELAPEGPLPPRPAGEAPASPLGDLTPDWETAPGAAPAAQAVEAVPAEGLVPAVDSMDGPARVRVAGEPAPPAKGAGMEIPAVPGRPDLPETMVAGPPAELAPTEAVGAAMQEPTTALARRQQEATRLAAETQSPEVQRVLAEHARKLERQAAAEAAKQKRLQDAAELRRVAAQTADPEIQQALHARAATLEAAEPVPAGKAKELGAAPAAKPAKEPAKPVPVGEVTEIAAEVVEPAAAAAPAAAPVEVRPPRTEPRVGKAGPKDKFVVGRVYRDSQGNMAIRQADGSWKEIK